MLVALGIWFGLSALAQVTDWPFARLRWMRAVAAIPDWRLFGPRPTMFDFELLYRDRCADGSVTPVRHVPLRESRRWWHVVWNPRDRVGKVLSDCVRALDELRRRDAQLDLAHTLPYAIVGRHVLSHPAPSGSTHRQFVIARSGGHAHPRDVDVVLVSRFHALLPP